MAKIKRVEWNKPADLTYNQVTALLWLSNRGGDGVFNKNQNLVASGQVAPVMRGTWNALQFTGYVEFYLNNRRIRITDKGKATAVKCKAGGVGESKGSENIDFKALEKRYGEEPD